jgi:beta-mannanase
MREALGPVPDAARQSLVASSATPGAPYSLALGAYIANSTWDPDVVDHYTALVGAKPAIIMWYQDWAHTDERSFDVARMNDVASRGVVPMISWEADDYAAGTDQPSYALSTIIQGAYDTYITQWAQAAAAWGKPFLLRPMWEMNGLWYPWSVGVNGNTGAAYIAAWRHIHDLVRLAGASNVNFVWCPSVDLPGTTPIAAFYPGDAYVDWIALDGYNWGTSRPRRTWQTVAQVFGQTYDEITALSDKPLLLAEMASTEQGGNKADWITQGFLYDLPQQFPRIRAVVWFDKDGTDSGESDWRFDSSATALAAFRSVAASVLYQGQLQLGAPPLSSTPLKGTSVAAQPTSTPVPATSEGMPQPCRPRKPCPVARGLE